MFENRPTLAEEVHAYDHRENPAARRSGTPSTPAAAQREIWASGADFVRGLNRPGNQVAFRKPAGRPR